MPTTQLVKIPGRYFGYLQCARTGLHVCSVRFLLSSRVFHARLPI